MTKLYQPWSSFNFLALITSIHPLESSRLTFLQLIKLQSPIGTTILCPFNGHNESWLRRYHSRDPWWWRKRIGCRTATFRSLQTSTTSPFSGSNFPAYGIQVSFTAICPTSSAMGNAISGGIAGIIPKMTSSGTQIANSCWL